LSATPNLSSTDTPLLLFSGWRSRSRSRSRRGDLDRLRYPRSNLLSPPSRSSLSLLRFSFHLKPPLPRGLSRRSRLSLSSRRRGDLLLLLEGPSRTGGGDLDLDLLSAIFDVGDSWSRKEVVKLPSNLLHGQIFSLALVPNVD
jgi:hypothetical protein